MRIPTTPVVAALILCTTCRGGISAGPATRDGIPHQDSVIHGRFLGSVATGVADRKMVVGNQRATTDRAGNFTLSGVSTSYDLAAIERDDTQVALYLGLSRRDPAVSLSRHGIERRAFLQVRMVGAQLAKDERLRRTIVRFLPSAARVKGDVEDSFGNETEYRFRNLSWIGPPTISGRVVASILHCRRDDCALIGFASKLLTLKDGDKINEELNVTELPVGHIAGTWAPTQDLPEPSLLFAYKLGHVTLAEGKCPLREPTDTFDCAVPDLSTLPGEYCVSVVGSNYPYGGSERPVKCGIRLGSTDLVIPGNLPVPPEPSPTHIASMQFTSPTTDQRRAVTRDSLIAWEDRAHSVYVVELRPSLEGQWFALIPRIFLFTSRTSFRWSELVAHGIAFPTTATYVATVAAIPASSVDQVASLDWWYGRLGESEQKPQSLFVTLFDPMAPTLNPNAPSNVKDLKDFPSGLPVCQSPIRGQVLDSNALGRMVTIHGNLKRTPSACLLGADTNCDYHWQITDVAGSAWPVSLIGATPPQNDKAEPPVPVAASGLLVVDSGEGELVLKQANLCLTGEKP